LTGLAPWDLEFPFPGSLISTLLAGARWLQLGNARTTPGRATAHTESCITETFIAARKESLSTHNTHRSVPHPPLESKTCFGINVATVHSLCPTEAMDQGCYRGTSLIRNSALLGSYRRPMHRALWWFLRGQLFLMSEIPLDGSGAGNVGRFQAEIFLSLRILCQDVTCDRSI